MGKPASSRTRTGSEASSRPERRRETRDDDDSVSRRHSGADPSTTSSRRKSSRRGFSDDDELNGETRKPSFTTSITAEPSEISAQYEDGRGGADFKSPYKETRRESNRRSGDSKHGRNRGTASDEDAAPADKDRRRKSSKQDKQGSTRAGGNHDASLAQNQFPGEIPSTYTRPYRPPGLAAEYYGDHGESVALQPGVRPNAPSIVTSAEQAHLMEPTLTAQPPPEPSSIGQVGAAASYFAADSTSFTQSKPATARPDEPPKQSNYGTSPRSSPRLEQSLPPLNQRPAGPSSSAGFAPAAVVGEAAAYYAGAGAGASTNTYQTPSTNTYQTPTRPAMGPQGASASYSAPAGFGGSQHHSNAALYGGAALAGAATGAYMSGHAHQSHSQYQTQTTHSATGVSGGPLQFQHTQQLHRHKHQGVFGKFVDWFRDPDAVAQYEQYTEAIGVCKYCFDPMSSPADAPRKHHPRRRRPSSPSRYGSTTRVEKTYKYSSDEGRRKRGPSKKVVLGGLAAVDAARLGDAVFKNRNDFDDTFSAKSGQPVNRSRVSFQDDYRYNTVLGGGERSKAYDRRTSKGDKVSERRKTRRQSSSSSSSASSFRHDSRGGAMSTGVAATGLMMGTAALDRSSRRRSKSRSRSPTSRKKYFSKRVSPMHSYVDLSTTNDGPGGLVGFFTSPSANKRKGKKAKGFFNFANASSSSSDEDLRFGEGTVRRKLSTKRRESKNPRKDRDHSTADIMGLVGVGTALAAEADRMKGKGKGRYDADDYSGRGGHHSRKPEMATVDHGSPPGERDDEWYDTDGDANSSVDMSLAYGGEVSADQKTTRPRYKQSGPVRLDGQELRQSNDRTKMAAPAIGGWMAANALPHESNLGQVPLMQELEPRPLSDPRYYDSSQAERGRRETVPGSSPQPPWMASATVPLKQPQPVVPAAPFIYENSSQPGPTFPTEAGGQTRPRRDSSPAKLESLDRKNNVSFDLPDEQAQNERRAKMKLGGNDAESKSTKSSRNDQAPARRRSSEASRGSFDSNARVTEIEQELRRLYDEQRRIEERERKQNGSNIVNAVAGGAVAAAGIAAVTGRGRKDSTTDDGTPNRKSSLKKTGETTQQERIARMAAQRVRSTPSPVQHDDYSSFFVPADIKEHLQEHNIKAEHREDIDATVLEIVPGAAKSKRRDPFDPFTYRPFGLDDMDDPSLHPWPVPKLDLIEPTPPGSQAHSIQGDASPLVEPKAAEPIDDFGEPLERKVSTGSKVTWGDPDTFVYEVQTPEYERGDYISQSELQRDGNSHETTNEDTSSRPSVSRAWTLDETEAQKLEGEVPVVDDRPLISRAWTIDDNEVDDIENEVSDPPKTASEPQIIDIGPKAEQTSVPLESVTEGESSTQGPSTSNLDETGRPRAVYESPFADPSTPLRDRSDPSWDAEKPSQEGDTLDPVVAASPEVKPSKSERRQQERVTSSEPEYQPPDVGVPFSPEKGSDIVTAVSGNDGNFDQLINGRDQPISPSHVFNADIPTQRHVESYKDLSGKTDDIESRGLSSSDTSIVTRIKNDQKDGTNRNAVSRDESVDGGFVSAEEAPEAPAQDVEADRSFLADRPEMPQPTDMDMPMGTDGVSGLTDTFIDPTTDLPNEDDRFVVGLDIEEDPKESVTATSNYADSRRLSAIRTDIPSSPATSSPTAVPLHFRRPPVSPTSSRFPTSSPMASPSSPLTTPRTRQGRPRSTEFRSSKEFRPLYLVEKRNYAKAPPEATEDYPSLPSSKTSSAHPSIEDLRTEALIQDESEGFTPSRISAFQERGRRHSHSYWGDGEKRRESPDYLDSRSATPVPGEVQRAREHEKPRPKYEFHSPSELLQDPSLFGEVPSVDHDVVAMSPLPSVMSTDVDQDYMSARSRSWSPSRTRSLSRGRKSNSTSRSTSTAWQDALPIAVAGALIGSVAANEMSKTSSKDAISDVEHDDGGTKTEPATRSKDLENSHGAPGFLPPTDEPSQEPGPEKPLSEDLQAPTAPAVLREFVPAVDATGPGIEASKEVIDLPPETIPESVSSIEPVDLSRELQPSPGLDAPANPLVVVPDTRTDQPFTAESAPVMPSGSFVSVTETPSGPLEQAFRAALEARGLTEGATVEAAFLAFQPEIADLGGTVLTMIAEEADNPVPVIDRPPEVPEENEQTVSRKASKKDKRRAKKASQKLAISGYDPDEERNDSMMIERREDDASTMHPAPELPTSDGVGEQLKDPPNPFGDDFEIKPSGPLARNLPTDVETPGSPKEENDWSFATSKGKKEKKDKKKRRKTLNLELDDPNLENTARARAAEDTPESSTAVERPEDSLAQPNRTGNEVKDRGFDNADTPEQQPEDVWETPLKSSKKRNSQKKGTTSSEGDPSIQRTSEMAVLAATKPEEMQPSLNDQVPRTEGATFTEQVVDEPLPADLFVEPSKPLESVGEVEQAFDHTTKLDVGPLVPVNANQQQTRARELFPSEDVDMAVRLDQMEPSADVSRDVNLEKAGEEAKDHIGELADDATAPVAPDDKFRDDKYPLDQPGYQVHNAEAERHVPDSSQGQISPGERTEEVVAISRAVEDYDTPMSKLASEEPLVEPDELFSAALSTKSKKQKRKNRLSVLEDVKDPSDSQVPKEDGDKFDQPSSSTLPDERASVAETTAFAAMPPESAPSQDADDFEFPQKSKKTKKGKKKRQTLNDDFGEPRDEVLSLPVAESEKRAFGSQDVTIAEGDQSIDAGTENRDPHQVRLPDTADIVMEGEDKIREPPAAKTPMAETSAVEDIPAIPGSFEIATADDQDITLNAEENDKEEHPSTFKAEVLEHQDVGSEIREDAEVPSQTLDEESASHMADMPIAAEEAWAFESKKAKKKKKRQSGMGSSPFDAEPGEPGVQNESTLPFEGASASRNTEPVASTAELAPEPSLAAPENEAGDTWGFAPKKKKDKKKNRKSKLDELSMAEEPQTDAKSSEVDRSQDPQDTLAADVDLPHLQKTADPAIQTVVPSAEPTQLVESNEPEGIAFSDREEALAASSTIDKGTENEAQEVDPAPPEAETSTPSFVETGVDESLITSGVHDPTREDDDAQDLCFSIRKSKKNKKAKRQADLYDFDDSGAAKAADPPLEEDWTSATNPKSKKDKKKRQFTFDDGLAASPVPDSVDQEQAAIDAGAASDQLNAESKTMNDPAIVQALPGISESMNIEIDPSLGSRGEGNNSVLPLAVDASTTQEQHLVGADTKDSENPPVAEPEALLSQEPEALLVALESRPSIDETVSVEKPHEPDDVSWSQPPKKSKKGKRSSRYTDFVSEEAPLESTDSDIKAIQPDIRDEVGETAAKETIPEDGLDWQPKPTKKSKKKKQKLSLSEDEPLPEIINTTAPVEENLVDPYPQQDIARAALDDQAPSEVLAVEPGSMQASESAPEASALEEPTMSNSKADNGRSLETEGESLAIDDMATASKKSETGDQSNRERSPNDSTVQPPEPSVQDVEPSRDGNRRSPDLAEVDWELPTKKSKKKSKNRLLAADEALESPGTETPGSIDQFESASQTPLARVASPERMEDVTPAQNVPAGEDYFAPVERKKSKKKKKTRLSWTETDETMGNEALDMPGTFIQEEHPHQEAEEGMTAREMEIDTAAAYQARDTEDAHMPSQPDIILQSESEHDARSLTGDDMTRHGHTSLSTATALDTPNHDLESRVVLDEATTRENEEAMASEVGETDPFESGRKSRELMATIPEEVSEASPARLEIPPDDFENSSNVSESTRERRKRRRSPPAWSTEEPADLPKDRSLTPPPDHDDIMDTAFGVAAGLGFGSHEQASTREPPPKAPSPVRQPSAGWSFARLAPATDFASSEANRDSAVQFESPILPADRSASQRDSGFIASPALEHGEFIGSRDSSMDMSLRPPRPQSPTSPTEDVSKTGLGKLETPRRRPSPVESTTKDRSSTLFNSSPAMPTPLNTKTEVRRSPELVLSPLRRSPSIHGHHRSREELRQHSDQLASNLIDRSAAAAVNRSAFESGPSDGIDRGVRSNNSLSAIREVSAEEPDCHAGSAGLVAAVGGAGLAAGALMASTSSREEPDAKALGGSKSRTSSLRNLRDPASPFDPANVASGSAQTPVGSDQEPGPSATRDTDMADVYDGYGSFPGSPRSPTRPASVRRRQSMQQIRDLEARLDQLASENRALAEAKIIAEQHLEQAHFEHNRSENTGSAFTIQLQERDAEIARLREEVTSLIATHETLKTEHEQNLLSIRHEHDQAQSQWQESSRELETLRSRHQELSTGMESIVRHEIDTALEEKDAEVQRLRVDLEEAREKVRDLQSQILARGADDVVAFHDEDYFDAACQKLCQRVQGWVLRFSKYNDLKACRSTNEVRDEKIVDRFDNAVLDGSDVDMYLADRIKRRDVFMSVVMTMIWEYVFTRYLFGMDREQRQKLKQLEKNLGEVGAVRAVRQWRALTLTLLSKREGFKAQRESDTEAVALEIFSTLSRFLPPPQDMEDQIVHSLRTVMRTAVDLSIEMRTQQAEYIMLPPLQPEYDTNGDLARKVYFNASLMNERSGETTSNEELEQRQAVVRMVLFPLVVKKGDDSGEGEEEIVVCPAQVLVARPHTGKKAKGSSRHASGGSQAERMSLDARSLRAASTHSLGAMSGIDVNDNVI